MNSAPALIDCVNPPTTSYFRAPDGQRENETRTRKHQRQQQEAFAKAADLQKLYANTKDGQGKTKGRLHGRLSHSMISSPKEIEDEEDDRGRFAEVVARAAALKKQQMTTCGGQEKVPEKVEDHDDDGHFAEVLAKAAAMKKAIGGEGDKIIKIRAGPTTINPVVTCPSKATTTVGGSKSRRHSAPIFGSRSAVIRAPHFLSREMGSSPSPPRAPPDCWQASLPEHQMDKDDFDHLRKEGYPKGLIKAMTDLKSDFAKQIWLIDNSESMATRDGTILADVDATDKKRFVNKCSRWDELQECVSSHIRLAGSLRQPTSIRLLNDPGPAIGPQRFGICESAAASAFDIKGQVDDALKIMARNSPVGHTPLTQHIKDIIDEVSDMRAGLLASGKRISIVICTDGVPSDAPRSYFLSQLRRLEKLPVWLVIRLCTNEPEVVDFYNKLDEELSMPVDILDDYQGEAIDACKHNAWLNYGMPLHRARERGFHVRILDFLDECPLAQREQKDVCEILFGKDEMKGCPEPDVDMPGFLTHVTSLQEKEMLQWDPIVGKMQPWIDFVGNPKSKLRKMGNLKVKRTTTYFKGWFGK